MALLDAQVGVLANQALNYFVSGQPPRRLGNAHPNIVPYQVFAVRDGHLIIAVGNDGQFVKLCEVLGRSELPENPKFATNKARVGNRDELVGIVSSELLNHDRDPLLSLLEAQGVPAGPINSVADVFDDPQVAHRELKVDLPATGSEHGTIASVRTPIRFSDSGLKLTSAAPRLGEHTDEILNELDTGRKGVSD